MDIRVLGPLAVKTDESAFDQVAPKPRKLLALLLAHGGQIVPLSALMAELWGSEPPVSAMTTLQTYVLQLRKALVTALGLADHTMAKEVLVTRAGGYLFQTGGRSLDLEVFQTLTTRGRRLLAEGREHEAAAVLDQALALWRGPAFADVSVGRLLEAERARLDECRLAAVEHRVEAYLRLGRHHEVLGDLAALSISHPYHESLQAQYMLALYRAGRRPLALDVYRRLRTTLVDEIGLEPSPRVRTLQQAILTSDPTLDQAPGRGDLSLYRVPAQAVPTVPVRA